MYPDRLAFKMRDKPLRYVGCDALDRILVELETMSEDDAKRLLADKNI